MNIGSNAGHTLKGFGSGAIGYLNESICTRAINNHFMEIAKENNIKTFDCTIDYSNCYLGSIVQKANKLNLDYAISHHLNYFEDAEANGVEVWIYNNHKPTYELASKICEELSKLGLKNRGVKISKNLYWLKHTKAKALLIEYCFCSNKSDTILYNPKRFAEATIKALLKK